MALKLIKKYQTKSYGCLVSRILSVAFIVLLLTVNVNGAPGDYDVNLTWFLDMESFEMSAHADIFCVQCHEALENESRHPDPSNIRKEVYAFFDKSSCSGSDCHEETLKDYEKGVHGRIRFENQDKYGKCIDCHDPHTVRITEIATSRNPEPKGRLLCGESEAQAPDQCQNDVKCLDCHSLPGNSTDAAKSERELCFYCHAQSSQFAGNPNFSHIPSMDQTDYETTEHNENRCTDCHTKSATYGHSKTVTSCRDCHEPHDEEEIHDPHTIVQCEACHLTGTATVDSEMGVITWQTQQPRPQPISVHHFIERDEEAQCNRCHFESNEFGASSMVLPPKGVFCIGCHTATFSISDTTTALTLAASLFIVLVLVSLWLTTISQPENPVRFAARGLKHAANIPAAVFSKRGGRVLKAVITDAIVQKKLFARSKWRWLSHELIFFPFFIRFVFGMLTLILSLAAPEWWLTSQLLDKNSPFVAFLFDLTGLLIILGVVFIVIRKQRTRKNQWPGLPRQEWLSFALIGGIVLIGFLLEGLRIAMTLDLVDKQFAFVGYAISLLFEGADGLNQLYGYVWYLHAILTAAFVIWLPFSRMFHIVMGPVAVAINAARKRGK